MRKTVITVLLLGLLSVVSCRPPATQAQLASVTAPSQLASSSPVPASETPSPVIPTGTPVPPTPADTAIPPAPTSTPAPAGLNPQGPYILFAAQSGIWLANPDGSYPTQLSDYDIHSAVDLHHLISSYGDRLALVVNDEQGLYLEIIHIPGGETEVITQLITSPAPEIFDPVSAYSFALYAIRDYESVAWQPGDGRMLAFTGAINGTTADLYLYDTETKAITQLTDGPSQAVLPTWSPDGQYILHFGISWVPPFGGAIGGANQFDGTWAVRAADGKIITLPKNMGSSPNFVGWMDNSHFITFDDGECSSENLRSVDVVSGEKTSLMAASFYYYVARSPVDGAILFSSAEGCPRSLGEGVFLLSQGAAEPAMLRDSRAWEVDWLPESGIFEAYPEGLFSSDGKTRYDTPVYDKSYEPAVSKLGYQAWEVIENFAGRIVVRIPDNDWWTILNGFVDALIWDPVSGQTLVIAMDDGTIYSASYPDFTPRLMGSLGAGVSQAIWVP